MILGKTVGFQTGPVTNAPPSGLLFATVEILAIQLRLSTDAEIMSRYRIILLDEAHERSLAADMTLALLRNFYARNEGNENLPFLLLTSATFDEKRYAAFFGLGPANTVVVTGRSHGITTHWPSQGTNNYPAESAAVALRINEENDDPPTKADILIFVPGAAESKEVVAALKSAVVKRPFLVLVVNREVVAEQMRDYALLFVPPDKLPLVNGLPPQRRIIVATVVAETGLTVNTLRYVIDAGWSRTSEAYFPQNVKGLITRPAPRSRITQRMGRAGRLFPGDFYPLYTQNVFTALDHDQAPEIITVGPGPILLAMVSEQQRQKVRLGITPEFRVEDAALLDPPAPEAFHCALTMAVNLGFISPRAPLPDRWPPSDPPPEVSPLGIARGYGLTELGRIAAAFSRAPMEGARIILEGYVEGVAASDLITAVATFGYDLSTLLEKRGRPPRGAAPGDLPPAARALRDALPPFLQTHRGGGDAPMPPAEEEMFYFRTKALLADDFVEIIFIFDEWSRRVNDSKGDLGALVEWCKSVGLNFTAMEEFSARRDMIIEDMIMAGLSPDREADLKLRGLPASSFIEGLSRFKRCIYAGLKGRLLVWDGDRSYVSKEGVKVKAPAIFTDAHAARLRQMGAPEVSWRPRMIVTDQVVLQPAQRSAKDPGNPLLWVPAAGLVSVMDGFVEVDKELEGPRVPGFVAS